MARPPRLELPGVPLHVIQRGNNRAACFFSDVDRRFYLKCLARSASRAGCSIHAYVLMPNHVHLLVTPSKAGSVGAMMQEIGRRYVRVINTLHGRTGTLWEGRFKSCLVDSETYLLVCHAYIELNPVRAGLAAQPASYPWSSHAHYTSAKSDRLITEHGLFLGFGADRSERQAAFRSQFVNAIDRKTLTRIRDATNSGSALGSADFLRAIEQRLGRPVRRAKRGRPPGCAGGKQPEALLASQP
jgi:putative transposase